MKAVIEYMKKTITVLLAALMIAAMVSCSDEIFIPDMSGREAKNREETTTGTNAGDPGQNEITGKPKDPSDEPDDPDETIAEPEDPEDPEESDEGPEDPTDETTEYPDNPTDDSEETTSKPKNPKGEKEETTTKPKNPKDDPEETTAKPKNPKDDPEETTVKPKNPKDDPEETTAKPKDEPAGTDGDDLIGKNSGLTYQNKYFNNKIILSDGWALMTDAEIRAANEQILGKSPKNYTEALKNADYFYDMEAVSSNGQFNISIVIQNLNDVPADQMPTEKEIISNTIDMMKKTYEESGYTNVVCKSKKITFCGKTHDGLALSAMAGDTAFYLEEIINIKGNYYESVTVACFAVDASDQVFSMFSKIK